MKKLNRIYLAIPYTKMDGDLSFKLANEILVYFINKGYNVFSPITHSHPLTKLGVRGDWEFWEQVDLEFIDWADEMIIIIPPDDKDISGVELVKSSTGVQAEIDYCIKTNKKVRYFDYETNKFVKIPELILEE